MQTGRIHWGSNPICKNDLQSNAWLESIYCPDENHVPVSAWLFSNEYGNSFTIWKYLKLSKSTEDLPQMTVCLRSFEKKQRGTNVGRAKTKFEWENFGFILLN
jgi:hypothetical protein